jgi:hypothetical protein
MQLLAAQSSRSEEQADEEGMTMIGLDRQLHTEHPRWTGVAVNEDHSAL